MSLAILPPFNSLRLPRVYEEMLNSLYRFTWGNDSETVISIAKFSSEYETQTEISQPPKYSNVFAYF